MSNKLRPSFKIHGGKYYLSEWVVENFPKDYEKLDYIEPYCGAASVLLNKNKSEGIEVINDINDGVMHIHYALRDEPDYFIKKLKRITYSENVFNRELHKYGKEVSDYVEKSLNEFVVRRMSRGGLRKNFAWSNRARGGQPGDVNAWKTIIDQLPEIAERLKDVYMCNKKAIEIITAFNNENTLCYCDPPYDPDERTAKDAYGEDEMSTDDHIELADVLNKFKGKVMISGYASTLYKRLYKDWNSQKKPIANHSSQSKTKKTKIEYIWMNY